MLQLSRAAFVPLRIRLTVVLVLLVAGVAAIVGASSYRLLRQSIESDILESVQASSHSLAESTAKTLSFRQEQVRSHLKAVDLGCGVSGVMAQNCAEEMLQRFLQSQQARGAVLSYNKGGLLRVGNYSVSGVRTGGSQFAFDDTGEPFYYVGEADAESGTSINVQFTTEVLKIPAGRFSRGIVIAYDDRLVGLGESLATHEFILKPENAGACIAGHLPPGVVGPAANEHYVSYAPVPNMNLCAVAFTPKELVLLPATRWRSKLIALVLIAAASGIIVAYLIALVLARPLTLLQRRIKAFQNGDFESPVPLVGGGELLELSQAFAQMAESVSASRSALVESENRLRLAYRAASLWMWKQDLKTGIIQWEGPEGGIIQQKSFRGLLRGVHPEDKRALCTALRTAKLSGVYEAEYRSLDADGAVTWISAWGRVVDSKRGKARTIVGVSLDVTARKQSEALLIEQTNLMATSEMAATLAHEINNPLTSVIGAVYMAQSTPGLTADATRFLRIAQDEARRVAQIGRQILSLYRKPGTAEVIDLRLLWEAVIGAASTPLSRKHLQVERQLEPARVFGFREELRHAFASLLINAIESAPAGSTLHVRVRNSRSFVRLGEKGARVSVADSGPGIAIEKLHSVFEPFVGTKPVAGAGLGLWATRAAVVKHGGTIKLRTVTQGKTGTCVSLYLPARCAAAAITAP